MIRQRQRFESETSEEREDPRGEEPVEESESRQRLPSRGKRSSLLIELAGDDGLHQTVPSSEIYASLDAALEVQSKLLRSARPITPDKGSMQQRRALEGTEERETTSIMNT